ncbi:MAG: CPBP family intramembrane metalloprotease [Deltaproteobacteria bacterium]|nr:CPBP family intramembrane metalloprotease [Deltaproteobacteria bacterium]
MAIGVLLASVASYLVVAIALQSAGLTMLLVVVGGELALLLLPLYAIKRLDLRRSALGLRWPPAMPMIGAVLIGSTAWYLNMRLVALLPFDEGRLRQLSEVVDAPPLVLALFALALIPAICEEVLFRGAVQRAIATRLFAPAAIVLSSLIFSAYHMSPIQLVPTFTLGLALGALAWRADSIAPAMLAHFLNNTMAVLVSRRQPPALAGWFEVHPNAALAGCAIATVAGLVLIARTPT